MTVHVQNAGAERLVGTDPVTGGTVRVLLGPNGWFIRLDAPRAAADRAPASGGFGGKEAPTPKPLQTASLRGIKASELTLEQALVLLRSCEDQVRPAFGPAAALLISEKPFTSQLGPRS